MKKLFTGIYFLGAALYFLFACFLAYLFGRMLYTIIPFAPINLLSDGMLMFPFAFPSAPYVKALIVAIVCFAILVSVSMIIYSIFMVFSFKKRSLLKRQVISFIWLVLNLCALYIVPDKLYYLFILYVINPFVASPLLTAFWIRNIVFFAATFLLLIACGYNFLKNTKNKIEN